MGVITSIRRNVKNAGRCSVFVDDEFLAACPIDVALALGLRKGLAMSDELERRLRAEDRRMVLRQKAYRFATYKPRTERDIRRFLDRAEATEEESADVLRWLAEFRLIDDAEYARRFIDASRQRKPLSPAMMRRTLLGKGLSESIVESAIAAETDPDDAHRAARTVARKKLRMITSDDIRSTEDKLVRFLQYRGYTWDVIKGVISEWKNGSLVVAMIMLTACAAALSQPDTSCSKSRLSETINAFQPATQPVQGADGALYFDRKFHPDNPDGATADPDQVWVTRQRAGRWQEPQLAELDVPEARTGRRIRADVVFGFSTDNLRALLAGRFASGSSAMSLVLAHRTTAEGPFMSYQVIVPDLGRNFYATCTDDGSTIIVALERPGGKGDLDLYRITNNACGVISAPLPLADNINTASFDGAPWLACDGETLYFASAGREDRRGKSDLYMTRRLDATWTRWSDPVNLGSCINTTEDETSVSLPCGSSRLYFTSWDATTERAGVYSALLADSLLPKPMVRTVVSVRDAIADTIVRGLHILKAVSTPDTCPDWRGWPNDARTGSATFMFQDAITTPTRIGSHPHWQILQADMDETPDGGGEITFQAISLQKPLCSIFFAKADTLLPPEGHAALEALRSKLGTGSLWRLRVVGWTDGSGSAELNSRISRARARIVAEQATILVPDGEMRHIDYEGRGVEMISGRRADDDAPNSRRVDLYVLPFGINADGRPD